MQKTAPQVYFISDFHLGIPSAEESLVREKKIIDFLQHIRPHCTALYLLGDIFDFWFEYRRVVPKGFTRLLGTLSLMADAGLPIYYFAGNHDLWMHNYLRDECGLRVFRTPQVHKIADKRFLIAHGDGLGPKDKSYKILKKIFENKILQSAFANLVHPDFAMRIGLYFSRLSHDRQARKNSEGAQFLGIEKENLAFYCKDILRTQAIDYFVFGHRHTPVIAPLGVGSAQLCNTGDWIKHYSYLRFDGEKMKLAFYK